MESSQDRGFGSQMNISAKNILASVTVASHADGLVRTSAWEALVSVTRASIELYIQL